MKFYFILIYFISELASAAPLFDVADTEFKLSKKFIKLEMKQEPLLYKYVRLVKGRYLLEKEIPWVSKNILNTIYLQSQVINLRIDSEN